MVFDTAHLTIRNVHRPREADGELVKTRKPGNPPLTNTGLFFLRDSDLPGDVQNVEEHNIIIIHIKGRPAVPLEAAPYIMVAVDRVIFDLDRKIGRSPSGDLAGILF